MLILAGLHASPHSNTHTSTASFKQAFRIRSMSHCDKRRRIRWMPLYLGTIVPTSTVIAKSQKYLSISSGASFQSLLKTAIAESSSRKALRRAFLHFVTLTKSTANNTLWMPRQDHSTKKHFKRSAPKAFECSL